MMCQHHNVEDQEDFLCYATGQSNGMVGDHVKEYMLLINNHRDELNSPRTACGSNRAP